MVPCCFVIQALVKPSSSERRPSMLQLGLDTLKLVTRTIQYLMATFALNFMGTDFLTLEWATVWRRSISPSLGTSALSERRTEQTWSTLRSDAPAGSSTIETKACGGWNTGDTLMIGGAMHNWTGIRHAWYLSAGAARYFLNSSCERRLRHKVYFQLQLHALRPGPKARGQFWWNASDSHA